MKRQFVMLFLLFTAFCFSQNFPYLNASTGNPNFFTDSDTNMYMIHGNRLAKMDKNFNPIWVNTYGSLSLKNILLSKTGSMYFIAAQTGSTANSIIGKMEASGNVSWMKSTSGMSLTVTGSSVSAGTLTCSNLFMSSDNNLLLSGPVTGPGNAALIKMDTLGNLIVARTFSLSLFVPSPSPQVSSVNILNEVSGVVNLVSLGNPGFGAGVSLEPFSYSIPGDSIVSSNQYNIGGCANCTADFAFNFFKSKTRSDVFYLFGHIEISSAQFGSPIPLHFALGKYNMTTRLWNQEYRWNVPPAPSMDRRLDEDEKGNIFGVYNVINGSQLGSTIYHSGFVHFDSIGNFNGNWTKYFNGYNTGSSFNYPDDRVNVVHNNRYFMNVAGAGFSTNPLVIETISPNLTMSCSTTVSLTNIAGNTNNIYAPISKPVRYIVTSLTMPAVSPTVSAVSGFSVSPNFCIVMNTNENDLQDDLILYPNPANNKLFISNENGEINGIKLFDFNGKEVIHLGNSSEINTSALAPGIYLIRLYTNKGVRNKKFVKE